MPLTQWRIAQAAPHKAVSNPLVIAVEADTKQAAQLTQMFERQFSVDLVLVTSAADALAAVQGRVPDLVLTSALLPPKDDAALTAWLRSLGPAAAHVQTVTIPTLAGSEPPPEAPRRSGALARVRERTPIAAPDSCEPAVFADWITVYLDLASTGRAAFNADH